MNCQSNVTSAASFPCRLSTGGFHKHFLTKETGECRVSSQLWKTMLLIFYLFTLYVSSATFYPNCPWPHPVSSPPQSHRTSFWSFFLYSSCLTVFVKNHSSITFSIFLTAGSHSLPPPVGFPFQIPLYMLCLIFPSLFSDFFSSLLLLSSSSQMVLLLSPPSGSIFNFVHITFISLVLCIFPIPTLSSVRSMRNQSRNSVTSSSHGAILWDWCAWNLTSTRRDRKIITKKSSKI